jgi:phospholipase/lecithinase/hemolysin
VDSALVAQYLPTVLSLEQQVQTEFVPLYGGQELTAWEPSTTLFAIWIGINDVGNSYAATASGNTTVYKAILSEYASLVNQLYITGARNFLFLNVPPVDRSPLTASSGPSAQALEASRITLFNSGVTKLARNLAHENKQNNVFLYDAHTLFEEALDNPQHFPQTALYRNTTDFCFDYENGTVAMDTFNASCGYPVNQYFWLNSLHPTYPMHDLLASKVAMELKAGSCV